MQAMLARVTNPITYQGFQHFITHSVWDADRIWRRLLEVFPGRRGVLIIDGTSFPKQGTHSGGVARLGSPCPCDHDVAHESAVSFEDLSRRTNERFDTAPNRRGRCHALEERGELERRPVCPSSGEPRAFSD